MFTRRKCYNKYHTIKRTTSLLLVSSSLRLFLGRISPIIDVLIHLQIFRCPLLSGPMATHPHHVRYQRRYLLQPRPLEIIARLLRLFWERGRVELGWKSPLDVAILWMGCAGMRQSLADVCEMGSRRAVWQHLSRDAYLNVS
jgi:hypothetical protein